MASVPALLVPCTVDDGGVKHGTYDFVIKQITEEENVTAADRLIIESPTQRGLIVLRALAAEPNLMVMARRALAGAQCRIEPLPTR